MRRLIFGLGSAQMLVTAALLAAYLILFLSAPWESAVIIGLAFSMSSTAIVMATLGERGELGTEHGRTTFAVLMSQDLWIVPVMALVPILAHTRAQSASIPLWEGVALVLAVIVGIIVVGRWLLPAALGYCADRRQMDAFAVVLFLAVAGAAWAVDRVGISMTLGAFLLGMLLSASELRYQIEAIIAPFKATLMGLFFIAVGMSIDIGALAQDWATLLLHVPTLLALKAAVLMGLIIAFGVGRSTAIRTGFYLSQVGEFAFVLLGAAAVAGMLPANGHTLALLVVAVSMILTPLMVKVGDRLANRHSTQADGDSIAPPADAVRHVVIIGYDEVGQLIGQMLEKANIPHFAITLDINAVRRGQAAGRAVYFGDMLSPTTQASTGLGKAAAVYVTSQNTGHAKALAVTLHRLSPDLPIYVRVQTLADQAELVAMGIRHAGTGYIESTLTRGSTMLKDLGMSADEVDELVTELRQKEYALIRNAYAEFDKQS
jgi:glutathione-regulated potassium-efflux system protein KefB